VPSSQLKPLIFPGMGLAGVGMVAAVTTQMALENNVACVERGEHRLYEAVRNRRQHG
jgi:hypothetical protein